MSFQAMAWAIKQKAGSPVRKMLLLCLANYSDAEGQSFPSHALLAREAECSLRTVVSNLAELERRGLIKSHVRRRADGTQTSSFYALNMQSAGVAHGKANRVQLTTHQSAGAAHQEPITEPITYKNGNLNGEGKKGADREKLAQGFKRLASLITIQEPGRRSA